MRNDGVPTENRGFATMEGALVPKVNGMRLGAGKVGVSGWARVRLGGLPRCTSFLRFVFPWQQCPAGAGVYSGC
jgi:hypothetical protein